MDQLIPMLGKIRLEPVNETHWDSEAFAGHYFDFTSDLLLGVDSI